MEGKSFTNDTSQKRIMVQRLLSEIYHNYQLQKQLDSSTETSCFSDGHSISSSSIHDINQKKSKKLQQSFLQSSDIEELYVFRNELNDRNAVMSTKLVRQLKQRNRLRDKNKRYCDTITAVLQAVSKKRKVDAKLQFSMEPVAGEDGFKQWCDALRAIIRLPGGLPSCWRKRVWICLANHYFERKHTKMQSTLSRVFSDRICPTDESLGNQIVKDLHRTGYSSILKTEEGSMEERMVLKRVLLAYARWNQAVGYCQGFNVLAALILQVTQGDEQMAFKIMVHLVDGVLPENYYANNLQALSVDMAVFRDLLKLRLPNLSKHLDALQKEANENPSPGSNYEPPVINVFTMQWFLTLFVTCLPADTVLRVWDSVMLDGNEILLRVALAIWAKLGEKVGETQSADEFYCCMSELLQQALTGKLIDGNELIQLCYRITSFPFPHLKELREKYTYNITPFAAENADELNNSNYSPKHVSNKVFSSQELVDYEDTPFFCFSGLVSTVPAAPSSNEKKKTANRQNLELANSRDRLGDAYKIQRGNGMMAERMSTDIAALKNQYMAIRSRQLRAHLIYTKPATANRGNARSSPDCKVPVMVNHLMIGRQNATLLNSSAGKSHEKTGVMRKPKMHNNSLPR
ncbi:TBC1 domain family member 30-like [Clavelina lepadiformis]|uniref:TBC1 domain family member 30-like n=1 Tax=Clavelina lepadiformis TaxID=159417 RepID=UPI004041A8BD